MRFNHLSNFYLVFVDRLVYKLSIFVDMKKLYLFSLQIIPMDLGRMC